MHVKEIILKAESEVIHVRLIAWCNGYKQHKSWKIVHRISTENCAWRLDLVQNLCEFWQFFSIIYNF